jgi:hypothetical protein
LQADQLMCKRSYPFGVIAMPPKVHPHIATLGPTHTRKRLSERREIRLRPGIVFVEPHVHANASHPLGLLSPCHYRPRRRAEPRNERSAL